MVLGLTDTDGANDTEGVFDGALDGLKLGFIDGALDTVGLLEDVGRRVGVPVGLALTDGFCEIDGIALGLGDTVGALDVVGLFEGAKVGLFVGAGLVVGFAD